MDMSGFCCDESHDLCLHFAANALRNFNPGETKAEATTTGSDAGLQDGSHGQPDRHALYLELPDGWHHTPVNVKII